MGLESSINYIFWSLKGMDCYRYLLLEIRTVVNFSGYSIDLLMLVTDLTQCCVVLATKPRSVPILNLLLLNFFKPFQLSFGTRTDLKNKLQNNAFPNFCFYNFGTACWITSEKYFLSWRCSLNHGKLFTPTYLARSITFTTSFYTFLRNITVHQLFF